MTTAYGAMTRFIANVTLPEGLSLNLKNEQFVELKGLPISGEIPDIDIRLNLQKTVYADKIHPVDYRAEVTIGLFEDGSLKRADELLRVNAPVKRGDYHFTLEKGYLSPRFSVKGCNVIPDGKRFQASVVLTGHKYACGVGVEFDCADGSPSEKLSSEYASTSACEKSQLIHKSSQRTVGAFSRM